MKPLKLFVGKLSKALLGFLGFSAACTSVIGQERRIIVAYGAPSTLYKVRGEIVDEDTDKPIQGLRVVLYREETFVNNKITETRVIDADTVYTNILGRFSLELFPKTHGGKTLLKIEDIDGLEKGSYPDTIIEPDLRNADRKPNREPTLPRMIAEKDLGRISLTDEEKEP